jgi:hypothetical protein
MAVFGRTFLPVLRILAIATPSMTEQPDLDPVSRRGSKDAVDRTGAEITRLRTIYHRILSPSLNFFIGNRSPFFCPTGAAE